MLFQHFVSLSCLISLVIGRSQPQLQPPTGHYKTGVLNIPVTDHSRKDLFSPTNDRKLMLSIFYPTSEHSNSRDLKPYINPIVASLLEQQYGFPNGSLATILANSKPGSTPLPLNDPKRLLFSHGGGTSRFINTALHEDLASYGYIVISVDHPYDAAAVEFPDGSVIYRFPFTDFTPDLLDLWYRQRIDDIKFVNKITDDLSILYHSKQKSCPPALGAHSFGGAAMAGVLIEAKGKGYVGGFNFDGAFWNDSLSGDAVDPFFIMAGPVRIPAGDTSFDTFRAAQTGWERETIVNGTQHYAFTDLPGFVEALGIPRTAVLESWIGTIAASRAFEIQRVYIRSFLDKVFGKGSGELVNGPSRKFPEVTFVS